MTSDQLKAARQALGLTPNKRNYAMDRHAAITQVADHIAPYLKPGINPHLLASMMIDGKDAAPGDLINLEVPKDYTIDGNPFLTDTTKPDDE